MRRVILFLLAAAIFVALAWVVASLPGHMTLTYGDTIVEARTPVAVLAGLILLAVVVIVLRLLGALVGLPTGFGRWRSARRQRLGEIAITRALLALAAGEKSDARREAARSRRMLGDTPQTLLLAAEAGRLADRPEEAESAFKALAGRDDAAFLGYRGLLRQAIEKENWTEAAELARKAEAAHPGAAWLRQERAQLAIRTGNWAEALDLSDGSVPKAALATAAAEQESEPNRALRLAKIAWNDDPSLAPAALAYASRLRLAGRESRAQSVLRQAWTRAPHPEIAAAALAPVTDKLARTKAAQALAAANPAHPESRLLLARTALEAGLTGEARHHAEGAREAGLNQRRLWLLLAEIEEEERGDSEEGRLAQREALRHAAAADPDDTWRCSACHTAHASWHPACPNCGAAGSLRWTPAVAHYPAPAVITAA